MVSCPALPTVADIPLLIYLLIGPGLWVVAWISLAFARHRMNKLQGEPLPVPGPPPHVTIVVPAKDEASHIETCVRGLLKQDYPNFDVRVIDDRSTDGTSELLDRLVQNQSAAGPRLSVDHVKSLPAGWLGKCHALHHGTRDISSPWILFVDSDVTLEPHALRAVLSRAVSRKYDAVSILTRLDGRTFWERLMIPVCGAAWSAMFIISWTNEDSRKENAVANGQFILVKRETYEHIGGHAAVKMEIVEDVELMRTMKSADARCRLYIGAHLAATRMHATLAELRSGWGRIFAGTARYRRFRILLAILTCFTGILSVYPALALGTWRATRGDWNWLHAAGAHWILMTLFFQHIYRAARSWKGHALIPFISVPVLIRLLVEGLRRCGDRKFVWRGTDVQIENAQKSA